VTGRASSLKKPVPVLSPEILFQNRWKKWTEENQEMQVYLENGH